MQNSAMNVNPNMKFTPNYQMVVNPPSTFYKYSIYNDIKNGERLQTAIIRSINESTGTGAKTKRHNIAGKIVKAAIGTGIIVLGITKRKWIGKQFKNIIGYLKK